LTALQPVILIGMHRSGTSLLTRLLGMVGVQMGQDLSKNDESRHLRALNEHTFHAAQATWTDPERVIEAMQSPVFVAQQASAYRERAFAGWGGLRFWGLPHWLELQRGAALPPWGWKDPRTSLTLMSWLQVFPQAHVVHIYRNGVDVAISLHRRELAQTKRRRFYTPPRDPRGLDFRFCFSLWEHYQGYLLTYRDTVPSSQYLEVRYETLLREPEKVLPTVLNHIGLPPAPDELSASIATINKGRLNNAAYAAAYQEVIPDLMTAPLMRELGYIG
jgi:LPS sulfotransferase NodH